MQPTATYETKTLRKVLKALSHFTGRTHLTRPIYSSVAIHGDGLFSAYDDGIQCNISNYEDSFEIANTGVNTTANLRQLLTAVEAGKKATYVTITQNAENTLTLATTLKTNMPTFPIDAFIELDIHNIGADHSDEVTAYATINYDELMQLTPFAPMYNERERGESNCLYAIRVVEKTGKLAVTDGSRAHTVEGAVVLDKGVYFDGITLDVEALRKLRKAVKALGIKPDVVQVYVAGKYKEVYITVKGMDYTVTVRHREAAGGYPRFEQLFPTSSTHNLSFDIVDMLEALAEVKPFANERTLTVKLAFQPTANTITLSVDLCGEITTGTPIHAIYHGWDAATTYTHLRIQYLVESLKMYKALNISYVQFATNGTVKPVLITPTDVQPNGLDDDIIRRHLIFPVVVKESN